MTGRWTILGALTTMALACGDGAPDVPEPPDPYQETLKGHRTTIADCLRSGGVNAVEALRRAMERPDIFRPNLTGRFDSGTAGVVIDEIEGSEDILAEFDTAPDGTQVVRMKIKGAQEWKQSTPSNAACDQGLRRDVVCVGADFAPAADGGTPEETAKARLGHSAEVTPDDPACGAPRVFPCDFATEEQGGRWGSEIECGEDQPAAD